jgi:hypothetical protein
MAGLFCGALAGRKSRGLIFHPSRPENDRQHVSVCLGTILIRP